MADLALVFIGPTVLVVVIVAYAVALKTRRHYTSRLTCPKCSHSFDYNWVPLASFSAVRLGASRYLKCPSCRAWSNFNVWDTRIRDPANLRVACSGEKRMGTDSLVHHSLL